MPGVVQILVSAEAAKAIAELGAVRKEVGAIGTAGDKTSTSSSKMGRTMKAGAIVAAGAVGVLALGLKKSVDAAADAQRVQVKLEQAMKNAGLSYGKYKDKIDDAITATSKLSGLDDEDLTESFSNMIRTTGNVNKALQLNALSADLARTKGMDLAGAQSLIARVYNGSFLGLKRLGVAFTPTTKAQDKLADSTKHATREQKAAAKQADFTANRQAAIAALQKAFAGQAEAYGKTTAGAQDRLGVSVENLEESIGTGLLPIVASLANTLAGAVDVMSRHTTATKIAAFAIGSLATAFLVARAGAAIYNSSLVNLARGTRLAALASRILAISMYGIPLVAIVAGLIAIGVGLVVLYKKSQTFRNIVNGAFNAVKAVASGVADFIRNHWQALIILLLGPLGAAIVFASKNWGKITSVAKAAINPVIGVVSTLAGWLGTAVGWVQQLIHWIGQIHMPSIDFPSIPGTAIGSAGTPPGFRTVAEHGAELVIGPQVRHFAAGTKVVNAGRTAGMMRDWRRGGGGRGLTVVVNAGPLDSLAARRNVGRTLATEVMRALDRSGREV